jgi:hypothetical protein
MAAGFSVFVNIGAKLLPSLNTAATGIERRFGQMNRRLRIQAAETKLAYKEMVSGMSPLAGMAAAGGLAFGFKAAIGDSSKLAHELQMLRNAGRTTNEVAAAMAAANRTISALPTTTLIDNLKVLNETTGAFGSFQHAMDNLTFNQRIGSMMTNMLGEHAGSPGEMFNNLARSMEMRGSAQDHTRYQREVGELYKAMVFTGGRVNPQEFFNFAQQSNPYIKGYSLRYLSRIAPSLIQEFGGDKAGTMSNTWTGTILGKAKNKISTEAWMKLGLLDPSQVVSNKVGPVGWRPGAIKGTDLALSDPLKWSETVLVPALQAHGFKMNDQLGLAKALMPLFRDRNAQRLANVLVNTLDRQRLHKDEGLINRVPGADAAYQQTLRRDPLMAWNAAKSSFTNLSSVLFGTGKEESPVAVALVHIANGVNMLAQTIEKHPMLGKFLGGALGLTAGIATLKAFGIAIRWVFSPLTGLWKLLFRGVGAMGPRIPWITRIGRFIGPPLLAGLRLLGPLLLRGLGFAFGVISGPVGWALLAVTAASIAYRFRHEIAGAWHVVTGWFAKTAWPAVRDTFLSLNWAGLGMAIADALTGGMASKLPATLSSGARGLWSSVAPTWLGGAAAPIPAQPGANPLPAGGNRSPNVVLPRAANDRGAGGAAQRAPITINIHGVSDPDAAARAVDRKLREAERRQMLAYGD